MSVSKDWWRAFFSGVWLDVQRQSWPAEQTRADADFIERALELQSGNAALDVPCGEGRLAIELAARGYRLTGVDITAALLDDARRTARQRKLEIAWVARDMRDLDFDREFDAAFCYWGSFGYRQQADDEAFLGGVFRALRPGGRFLVDAHTPETLFPVFQPRRWRRVGDTFVLEESTWAHETGRVETEWTLIRGCAVETRRSSIRLYTYRELTELFHRAGFGECRGYDTDGGEPFELGASRLALVGRKPG